MSTKQDLENQVFAAARDQGVSSVLFRNAMGRKLGLNSAGWECLGFLSMRGIATPTELARYSGLTTGSVTALLDRLEKAGFVRRKPNPKDRRGVLVEANAKWAETAAPLVAGVQVAHKQFIAKYSEAELKVILDFLTRFTKNVQEHTEKIEKGRL